MDEAKAYPLLEFRGVSKRYGDSMALTEVNLAIERQEVVCVLGPSGSGKSTMIRCANALETVDAGEVAFEGAPVGRHFRNGKPVAASTREVTRQRRSIGMVFQRFNLFPNLTALQNVCLGPRMVLKASQDQAEADAMELLDRVGIGEKAGSYPNQLSGGQQQRVAIARALALKPRLMLFDEPTSALDPEMVGEVLAVMRELATVHMTMLVVTHEIGFARTLADRVVFMDSGQIVEVAPPRQFFDDPATERAKRFLSKVMH